MIHNYSGPVTLKITVIDRLNKKFKQFFFSELKNVIPFEKIWSFLTSLKEKVQKESLYKQSILNKNWLNSITEFLICNKN
jgi:hypothetical protein